MTAVFWCALQTKPKQYREEKGLRKIVVKKLKGSLYKPGKLA